MRSARVDLPWSTWAMMEKLRMCCMRGRREGCRFLGKSTRDYRTGRPRRCRRRASAGRGADRPDSASAGLGVLRGDGDELASSPWRAHQQHHGLARLDARPARGRAPRRCRPSCGRPAGSRRPAAGRRRRAASPGVARSARPRPTAGPAAGARRRVRSWPTRPSALPRGRPRRAVVRRPGAGAAGVAGQLVELVDRDRQVDACLPSRNTVTLALRARRHARRSAAAGRWTR